MKNTKYPTKGTLFADRGVCRGKVSRASPPASLPKGPGPVGAPPVTFPSATWEAREEMRRLLVTGAVLGLSSSRGLLCRGRNAWLLEEFPGEGPRRCAVPGRASASLPA